ncbi:MAG: hypothetical protein KIT16_01530 [Rhodospirillaceae bacterium]|nr:hypothetical protein [Rhodospirillaceae bacterium]
MNEDDFNMSLRKFLKTVGVTAQREVEKAVRQAIAEGKLAAGAPLAIEAHIASPAVGLAVTVAGTLDIG